MLYALVHSTSTHVILFLFLHRNMSRKITWEEVQTPKDFENYVLQHLQNSSLKDYLNVEQCTGSCTYIPASSVPTDELQRLRFCVDIKGLYKGQKFVIDAKYYSSGRYISEKDVKKLVEDKKHYEAQVGFFLMFGASISKDMEGIAEDNNIFCIWVRNESGNSTHWIKDFASKFSG